jgi:hypothetical protein
MSLQEALALALGRRKHIHEANQVVEPAQVSEGLRDSTTALVSSRSSARRDTRSGVLYRDLGGSIQAAVAIFSAVQLSTGEFLRNTPPSPDITAIPMAVTIKLLLAAQLLPAVLLIGLDVFVARRYSPTTQRRFRSVLFAIAIILILRQLQLFFGPIRNASINLDAASPALYGILIISAIAASVWLAVRAHTVIQGFFAYFAPAALVLMLTMAIGHADQNKYYNDYDLAAAPVPEPSKAPVFIIIFDELSYEALLNDAGEIDAKRFPNFARLGSESLHLTNATSNYFRTWLQVPELVDSVIALSDYREIRMYEQTHRLEALYAPGCGSQYTCRGLRYLTRKHGEEMAAYIAMRAGYAAVPDWLEEAASYPFSLIARTVGSPPPPADPLGFHEITTALARQYLSDIRADNAGGRVFLLHSLLPHYPFVFDEYGEFAVEDLRMFPRDPNRALTGDSYEATWNFYLEQVAYADRFLGDLIARLEEEGLYEDATLVVTSDHGVRPSSPVWGDPIEIDSLPTHVPVFIRSPSLEYAKSDIDYQHADFGPTIFDLLGYDYPGDPVEGPTEQQTVRVSALDTVRPERDKVFFVDFHQTRFWRYEYNQDSGSWELAATVQRSLGDRTPLAPQDEAAENIEE